MVYYRYSFKHASMAQRAVVTPRTRSFPPEWVHTHCITVRVSGQVVDVEQIDLRSWMDTVLWYHNFGIKVNKVFHVEIWFMRKVEHCMFESTDIYFYVGIRQMTPSFSRLYTPTWALQEISPPISPLPKSD